MATPSVGNSLNESNLIKEFTKTNQMSGTKEVGVNDSDYFSNNESYYQGNPYGPSAKTKKFIEKIAPSLRETDVQQKFIRVRRLAKSKDHVSMRAPCNESVSS